MFVDTSADTSADTILIQVMAHLSISSYNLCLLCSFLRIFILSATQRLHQDCSLDFVCFALQNSLSVLSHLHLLHFFIIYHIYNHRNIVTFENLYTLFYKTCMVLFVAVI